MAVDGGFHLGAINILAAAQHHVLLAIDDEDEAVFIDAGDVAGVQPAIGDRSRGCFRAVDIALDDGGALHPQLADFARRHGVAGIINAFGLIGGHGGPGTVRLVDKEIAGDRRDDPAGLGHAVTGAWPGAGHIVLDLVNQIGRHLCTAARHRRQARHVGGAEIRVVDQFARHYRHAADGGDAFLGDDAQRFASVPAVHQHDGAAGRGRRIGTAIVGSDMEQRRGEQGHRHRRQGRRLNASGQLHRPRGRGAGIEHVEQIGDAATMGELRALGKTGGARCVEDAGIGIGIDLHLWHRPAVRQHIGKRRHPRLRPAQPHPDEHQAGRRRGYFVQAVEPLGIEEHGLWRRVRQCIGHFLGRPPRIHTDNGDAGGDTGPIDQHPFGIVAHGNRHPVAGSDALRRQPGCDGVHTGVGLAVGQPLLAIDKVGAVGERVR